MTGLAGSPAEQAHAEQLAWSLGWSPGEELALLRAADAPGLAPLAGISWMFARHHPARWSPTSAVVRLIQGVYELAPAQAHLLLRHRIRTTAAATPLCTGTVKVAAKQLTTGLVPRNHGLPSPDPASVCNVGDQADQLARESPRQLELAEQLVAASGLRSPGSHPRTAYLALTSALARLVPLRPPRYLSARPLAAVLVGADGAVLAWGLNSAGQNRTLHAEVNLLQRWCNQTGRGLPPGAWVCVSRKPCKMCAGFLWHLAEAPATLRVRYLEDDPGRNARETCLTPWSNARRQASHSQEELAWVIEEVGPDP